MSVWGTYRPRTLRRSAAAFRNGQLTSPRPRSRCRKVAPCPDRSARRSPRSERAKGCRRRIWRCCLMSPRTLPRRGCARVRGGAGLVRSRAPHAHSRDTLVVLDELLLVRAAIRARQHLRHPAPERVFATLAPGCDDVQTFESRMFLNIERRTGDTRDEQRSCTRCASGCEREMARNRRPEVYYDPAAFDRPDVRASWHAKCVLVDDEVAFVTSANSPSGRRSATSRRRLIRSRSLRLAAAPQFESLIQSKQVRRLPGF